MKRPPYTLSPEIVTWSSQISRLLGQYEGLKFPKPELQLRRKNRVKTIQGSLSIEGNSLSIEQVSDILENKRVIGPAQDILEVKNAIRAYEKVRDFKVDSEKSFLEAHRQLMEGLLPNAGKWRTADVGVLRGNKVIHMGPKAILVPQLMKELFHYLKDEKPVHFLITSAVLHYEIEFIHPFSDGNGRMGRLWHHVFLTKHHPMFEYLPIESVIKEHQKEYYDSLEISDQKGDSGPFIEFCLKAICETMTLFLEELKPEPLTAETRLELAKSHFDDRWFSRKDYRAFFKTLSTATASRDLQNGIEEKILIRQGDKALAKYQFRKL